MSMFGPKPGTVWICSEKDKRWDKTWKTDSLLFCGGIPDYVEEYILEKTKIWGFPPDDLEWGGMKD